MTKFFFIFLIIICENRFNTKIQFLLGQAGWCSVIRQYLGVVWRLSSYFTFNLHVWKQNTKYWVHIRRNSYNDHCKAEDFFTGGADVCDCREMFLHWDLTCAGHWSLLSALSYQVLSLLRASQSSYICTGKCSLIYACKAFYFALPHDYRSEHLWMN